MAAVKVPHSQTLRRTKRRPSFRSWTTDAGVSSGPGVDLCSLIRDRQAMETRKVQLSTRKATPVPPAAMRRPPRAGPVIRRANGRASWSTALAWGSWSSGTSSGTTASKAGPKKADAAP